MLVLVSARSKKKRCSEENLSVLYLKLFLPEMAWAMSKEESNRKAITERTSCVAIWAQFSSSDTNDCFSILCWPRCQHPCYCSGNHLPKDSNLLKVQIAFQYGSPPSDKQFAETSSPFLDSQKQDNSKAKTSEIKSKLNSNGLPCHWSQQ